jgi:putative transcriptional regulator
MKISSKTVAALEDLAAFDAGKPHRGRTTAVAVGEVDVRVIRDELGMSQDEFARQFGFSVATIKNWEQGRRAPEEAAKTLLQIIRSEPKLVARQVQRARAAQAV